MRTRIQSIEYLTAIFYKPLLTSQVKIRKDCFIKCLQSMKCISLNYCDSRVCEMNERVIHSVAASDINNESNCVYIGRLENSEVECLKNGQKKNIQNDLSPGFCEINQKRIYKVCSWIYEETDIVKYSHFKRYWYQVVARHALHGSGGECTSKVIELYFTSEEDLPWQYAKEFSENAGGKLLEMLDKHYVHLGITDQRRETEDAYHLSNLH